MQGGLTRRMHRVACNTRRRSGTYPAVGSLVAMQRAAVLPPPGEAIDPSEQALVERARGGDADAWSLLYHDHFHRLFKHVTYLVGDVHAAEDLVQETFARAFVGLAQFEGRSSVVGWLRGIAVNVARRHWRSRYRGEQAMTRLEEMARDGGGGDLEGEHLRQRRAEALLAALASLPEPLREAFVLCDLQELSTRDAAEELGVSPGNLRVRATRARARIREELTRRGWLVDAPTSPDAR